MPDEREVEMAKAHFQARCRPEAEFDWKQGKILVAECERLKGLGPQNADLLIVNHDLKNLLKELTGPLDDFAEQHRMLRRKECWCSLCKALGEVKGKLDKLEKERKV